MKKILLIAAAAIVSFSLSAQTTKEAGEFATDANVALNDGDNEAAIENYKKAIEAEEAAEDGDLVFVEQVKNTVCKIMLSIGKTYYNEKNFAAAIDQFNATIDQASEYEAYGVIDEASALIPKAKQQNAQALMKAGDFENAITAFEEILAGNPENANVLLNLASAYEKVGKEAEMIDAYDKALALGKTDAAKKLSNVFVKKAQASLKANKFAEAIEFAQKSNEYLENANAYKMAASAASKLGKAADAISYYEGYLNINPEAKDAGAIKYTIAVLYQTKLNNKAKAAEYYNQIADDPQYGAEAKKQIAALK